MRPSLIFVFMLKIIFIVCGDELSPSNFSSEDQSSAVNDDQKTYQLSPDIEDSDSVVYDSDIVDNIDSGVEIEGMKANNGSTEVTNSTSKNRLVCNITEPISQSSDHPSVILFNGSTYQSHIFEEFNSSVANRSQPAICSITMFFASWCQFSAEAAPHYNALARVFPQIRYFNFCLQS